MYSTSARRLTLTPILRQIYYMRAYNKSDFCFLYTIYQCSGGGGLVVHIETEENGEANAVGCI